MAWRCIWRVVCDECHAVGPPRHKDKNPGAQAEKAAADLGWLVVWHPLLYGGSVHLCPMCAAKERPAWWPVDLEEAK